MHSYVAILRFIIVNTYIRILGTFVTMFNRCIYMK